MAATETTPADQVLEEIPDFEENMPPITVRHDQSPQLAKLFAALAKAQGAMKAAKFDAEGQVGTRKTQYATLASCWDTIRKPLADNGLALLQLPMPANGQLIGIRTVLGHSSGQWICATLEMVLNVRDPQAIGSILTYIRRYALCSVIGISSGADDDAASAMPRHKMEPDSSVRETPKPAAGEKPPAKGRSKKAASKPATKPQPAKANARAELASLIGKWAQVEPENVRDAAVIIFERLGLPLDKKIDEAKVAEITTFVQEQMSNGIVFDDWAGQDDEADEPAVDDVDEATEEESPI